MTVTTVWCAGDQDAGNRRDPVRRLLASSARLHPRHRLPSDVNRIQDVDAAGVLCRRLLLGPLAGHVQQLRQSNHLRFPQRQLQGEHDEMEPLQPRSRKS